MKTSTKYRIVEVGSFALALLIVVGFLLSLIMLGDNDKMTDTQTATLAERALAIGIMIIFAWIIAFLTFNVSPWAGKKRRHSTAKEAYPDLAAFNPEPFPVQEIAGWPNAWKENLIRMKKYYDSYISSCEERLEKALDALKGGDEGQFNELITSIRGCVNYAIYNQAKEPLEIPKLIAKEKADALAMLQDHADTILKGRFIIAVAKQQGFKVEEGAKELANAQKRNDGWKKRLYRGDDLDVAGEILQNAPHNAEVAMKTIEETIGAMEAYHIIKSNTPTLHHQLAGLQKRYRGFPIQDITDFIDKELKKPSPAAQQLRENLANIKEVKDFRLLLDDAERPRDIVTMQHADFDDILEAITLFNNTSMTAIGLEHLLEDTLILYRACKEAEERGTTTATTQTT